MAKKQIVDKDLEEVKKLLKAKNLVIGTKRTMKLLKLGKLEKVYISSNCSQDVKEDLDYYNKISPIKVIKMKYPNDELGVLCKKPYSISVLSLIKGGN